MFAFASLRLAQGLQHKCLTRPISISAYIPSSSPLNFCAKELDVQPWNLPTLGRFSLSLSSHRVGHVSSHSVSRHVPLAFWSESCSVFYLNSQPFSSSFSVESSEERESNPATAVEPQLTLEGDQDLQKTLKDAEELEFSSVRDYMRDHLVVEEEEGAEQVFEVEALTFPSSSSPSSSSYSSKGNSTGTTGENSNDPEDDDRQKIEELLKRLEQESPLEHDISDDGLFCQITSDFHISLPMNERQSDLHRRINFFDPNHILESIESAVAAKVQPSLQTLFAISYSMCKSMDLVVVKKINDLAKNHPDWEKLPRLQRAYFFITDLACQAKSGNLAFTQSVIDFIRNSFGRHRELEYLFKIYLSLAYVKNQKAQRSFKIMRRFLSNEQFFLHSNRLGLSVFLGSCFRLISDLQKEKFFIFADLKHSCVKYLEKNYDKGLATLLGIDSSALKSGVSLKHLLRRPSLYLSNIFPDDIYFGVNVPQLIDFIDRIILSPISLTEIKDCVADWKNATAELDQVVKSLMLVQKHLKASFFVELEHEKQTVSGGKGKNQRRQQLGLHHDQFSMGSDLHQSLLMSSPSPSTPQGSFGDLEKHPKESFHFDFLVDGNAKLIDIHSSLMARLINCLSYAGRVDETLAALSDFRARGGAFTLEAVSMLISSFQNFPEQITMLRSLIKTDIIDRKVPIDCRLYSKLLRCIENLDDSLQKHQQINDIRREMHEQAVRLTPEFLTQLISTYLSSDTVDQAFAVLLEFEKYRLPLDSVVFQPFLRYFKGEKFDPIILEFIYLEMERLGVPFDLFSYSSLFHSLFTRLHTKYLNKDGQLGDFRVRDLKLPTFVTNNLSQHRSFLSADLEQDLAQHFELIESDMSDCEREERESDRVEKLKELHRHLAQQLGSEKSLNESDSFRDDVNDQLHDKIKNYIRMRCTKLYRRHRETSKAQAFPLFAANYDFSAKELASEYVDMWINRFFASLKKGLKYERKTASFSSQNSFLDFQTINEIMSTMKELKKDEQHQELMIFLIKNHLPQLDRKFWLNFFLSSIWNRRGGPAYALDILSKLNFSNGLAPSRMTFESVFYVTNRSNQKYVFFQLIFLAAGSLRLHPNPRELYAQLFDNLYPHLQHLGLLSNHTISCLLGYIAIQSGNRTFLNKIFTETSSKIPLLFNMVLFHNGLPMNSFDSYDKNLKTSYRDLSEMTRQFISDFALEKDPIFSFFTIYLKTLVQTAEFYKFD